MNEKDDTLLARWLEGNNLTPDELQHLQQEVDLPSLKQVLAQQKKYDLTVRSKEEMWQDFEKRLSKTPKKPPSKNKFYLLGGLVILAIIISLWFYFTQHKDQKIETLPAKTEIKKYADGTKIHISPKSSIEYNEATWTSQRNVTLDGQAFFEVEKGSSFTVTTTQGMIEVLGTQFDVWEMGDLMRVQCFHGAVKISSNGESKILKQNQQIIINNKSLGDIENLVSSQPDWIQGQRIYQKIPLQWVLKDIERFYDIKTDIKSLSTQDLFEGIIPTNDLNKALDYLTKPLNWTYEIKDKTIYFTGEN